MTTKGRDRAALRGEAHHLKPMVHIGHQGLTPAVTQALDDALRTHELVKVSLVRMAELSAKEAAAAIAETLGAQVIQVIGRTCTVYRHNPELERKPGALPPWRS